MSNRQQIIRTIDVNQRQLLDQQFWPIFIALCVMSAVLAAAIVTLMDGFWMWTSLMILPAAFAMVALTLLFVDNRKLQRSLQTAIILSMALHLMFVIFAHQTQIFAGIFTVEQANPNTRTEPRRIEIAMQTETQPWEQPNELETPTPPQPEVEREEQPETSPERPQPINVEEEQPTEAPEIVRNEQTEKTVPKLGENPSKLSKQTEQLKPKSGELTPSAKPAPNRTAENSASAPAPAETTVERQSASSAQASKQVTTENTEQQTPSMASQNRRRSERARPTATESASNESRRRSAQLQPNASASPVAENNSREQNQSRPTVSAAEAVVQRRSPESNTRRENIRPRAIEAQSPTNSTAQNRRRDQQTLPSVASQNRAETQPQRSRNVTAQPQSPVMAERPRTEPVQNTTRGTEQMTPRITAIQRSQNGTAGVGRSQNVNRDVGSTQSPAMVAADSARRNQSTSVRPSPDSFMPSTRSRTPRTANANPMSSSTMSPSEVGVANRAATQNLSIVTMNSSASITESNSDAQRGEVSAEKGTGAVDIGSTKIVTENVTRRVEGGGQPTTSEMPEVHPNQSERSGGAAPSLAASEINPTVGAPQAGEAAAQMSDSPTENATADVINRSGGADQIAGGPTRADITGNQPSTSSSYETAQSPLGGRRDSRDDSQDAQEIGDAMADVDGNRSRGRSSVQPSDNLVASSDSASGTDPSASQDADSNSIGDTAVDVARTIGNNLPASGVARTGRQVLGAAIASLPVAQSGKQRESSRPGASSDLASENNGRGKSSGPTAQPTFDNVPGHLASQSDATGQSSQIGNADQIAPVERSNAGGMALDIRAEEGPAGLGDEFQPDAGIQSRRASKDSPALQPMDETRFRKETFGGTPSVNLSPAMAAEAFRSRSKPNQRQAPREVDEAIESGLSFLARVQLEDGSWTLSGFDLDQNNVSVSLNSDAAATALALLAFQGAGYNHREFKYATKMQSAIDWMVAHQQPNGDLYVPSDEGSNKYCQLYTHGIAALALAEAYGMTQDERLREPVQRAIDFIEESQHPRLGGWRYKPGDKADTSVSGWMMMALQSARLAGIETEEKTWIGIDQYLETARDSRMEHLFRYHPEARNTPTTAHGRAPSKSMTAVGLLMRLYTGWNRDDPRLRDGADYLLEQMPGDTSIEVRDTYYWYYATQVLCHMGGNHWERWNGELRELLVNTQVKEGEMRGSWDPFQPVPDRWGAQAGRIYVTAMNLLNLEVNDRLLPLYKDTMK